MSLPRDDICYNPGRERCSYGAWELDDLANGEYKMLTLVRSRQSSGLHVTINSAFLQEVKEDNSQVWESRHSLRELGQKCLLEPSLIHLWVQSLTEFRKLLSVEFTLEETYGYVTRATNQHISVGVDPAVTLKQHKELYLHLLDVCEQVEESQYVGTIQRDFSRHLASFQEFDAFLSQHEQHESEMIRFGLGLRQRKQES